MGIELIYQTAIKNLSAFSDSGAFSVVKFILGIYALVVFVDIILLLVQRGVGGNIREAVSGVNIPPELTTKRKKMRQRWGKLLRRLDSGREAEYKIAVIEADDIMDDLLKRMGYPGENMTERIDNISVGQLEGIEILKEAHEIRNRIIHEDDFRLGREEAGEIISKYEHLLKLFEVLE